jgi:hypothetical protein
VTALTPRTLAYPATNVDWTVAARVQPSELSADRSTWIHKWNSHTCATGRRFWKRSDGLRESTRTVPWVGCIGANDEQSTLLPLGYLPVVLSATYVLFVTVVRGSVARLAGLSL